MTSLRKVYYILRKKTQANDQVFKCQTIIHHKLLGTKIMYSWLGNECSIVIYTTPNVLKLWHIDNCHYNSKLMVMGQVLCPLKPYDYETFLQMFARHICLCQCGHSRMPYCRSYGILPLTLYRH